MGRLPSSIGMVRIGVIALLVTGCASAPAPTSSPSPGSSPVPTAATASPSPVAQASPSDVPTTSPTATTPTPAPTATTTAEPNYTSVPNGGWSADEQSLFDIATVHISANIDGTGGPACKSLRNSLPAGA